MDDFDVRLASPAIFHFDPRYEQMRTQNIVPTYRVFGRHRRDQSQLLSLPDEILWRITHFIAAIERGRFLSQFALAHRKCRQLVRPHHFADMFITRSEKSWKFLRHLLREARKAKTEPAGWCPGPSIAESIRSITIFVDDQPCVDYCCSSDKEYEQWRKHWQPLINALSQAVKSAMPNLERVFWRETGDLNMQPRLLKAVLEHSSSESGRMHELALTDFKFCFYEELEQVLVSIPSRPIRLRSFALGEDEDGAESRDGCAAYLAENILRSSAPTMETCGWNSKFDGRLCSEDFDDGRIWFRDGPIEFRKLRKFWGRISGMK